MSAFCLCLFVAAVSANAKCAQVVVSADAAQPDDGISIGGGYDDSALFMSASNLYSVVFDDVRGSLNVSQVALGPYNSTCGVVTRYYSATVFVATIPHGSSTLWFLWIDANGALGSLFRPVSLRSVLPPSFAPTAAGVQSDPLGNMEALFFASADLLVCLFGPPTMFSYTGVFNLSQHFPNPLGVDFVTSVSVEEASLRLFISRVSSSAPNAGADVIVLNIAAGCSFSPFNQIFVQPSPIRPAVQKGLGFYGAQFYWTQPPTNDTGALFQWELSGTNPGVRKVELGLGKTDRVSPIGFTQPKALFEFFGVVVSQRNTARGVVTVTVVQTGDSSGMADFRVVCATQANLELPVGVASLDSPVSSTALARNLILVDQRGTFSVLVVPVPSRRKRVVEAALASCVPNSFGYPNTCAGCVPPSAVCGVVEHCVAGCCFVVGGRVMCCSQSPLNSTGFACM
jgi:hypothetical protein